MKYDVAPGSHQIVAGDFTRDGITDIATANRSFTYADDCGPGPSGSDSVSILPGRGNGTFGAATSFALGDQRDVDAARHRNLVSSLATSDLNGDGATDLIVSHGVLLLNLPPAPNRPPAVNAGEDRTQVNDPVAVLHAAASDPDGHWVTYRWTSSAGQSLLSAQSICVSSLNFGETTFTAAVSDGQATASNSVTITVKSSDGPPDPDALSGRDIGGVGAAGSSASNRSTYVVTGSGADIWNTSDEFHYASRTVAGDFEITARVESVESLDRWTKAGLMFREGFSAGARHASIFATPGKGVAFQRRTTAGGASVNTSGPLFTAPVWLKLVRTGDVVAAYYRKGIRDFWTKLGQQTLVGLAPSIEAGLAVTSHADGRLATATFSNVAAAPLPQWTWSRIGTTNGSATSDGVVFSVDGSGADIWGTSDGFLFVHTPVAGNVSITARVRSMENTHAWAKTGVMIRESLAPGSKHVDMIVSPGKGIAAQYRLTPGGITSNLQLAAGTAPTWVRLTRVNGVFEAYSSGDGVTWTSQGALGLSMPASAYIGLAVTSHNASALATSVFDDVVVTPLP